MTLKVQLPCFLAVFTLLRCSVIRRAQCNQWDSRCDLGKYTGENNLRTTSGFHLRHRNNSWHLVGVSVMCFLLSYVSNGHQVQREQAPPFYMSQLIRKKVQSPVTKTNNLSMPLIDTLAAFRLIK